MLTSDGLTLTQFLHLWQDAMFAAAPDERARLLVELGRVTVREAGRVATLLVAVVEGRDDPLVVMPLSAVPGAEQPGLRDSVRERLAVLGASEVYVLLSAQVGRGRGSVHNLLACWGERVGGDEVCALLPYRWTPQGIEEAELLLAPDARATTFSRDLTGLLPIKH